MKLNLNVINWHIVSTVSRDHIDIFKFMDANPMSTWSIAERIESYHCAYVCKMEAAPAKDRLELIWIDWQCSCSMNEKLGDARDIIINTHLHGSMSKTRPLGKLNMGT